MPTYTLPNDTQKGKDLRDKKLFIIDSVHDEIVFKASSIILGDTISKGNIIANFDLTVLGDLKAQEISVKGKLICYGNIDAVKVTADETIATKIVVKDIVSREGILAQELSADNISSQGQILVKKDITVEELVETDGTIVCGDGFYAYYGKVKAKTVMAVDNLEIQEGAYESTDEPIVLKRDDSIAQGGSIENYAVWKSSITNEIEKVAGKGDFVALAQELDAHKDVDFLEIYRSSLSVLKKSQIRQIENGGMEKIDLLQFLRLHKVFCDWRGAVQFRNSFDVYCASLDVLRKALVSKNFDNVALCVMNSYSEFIEVITIIQKHGSKIADGNALLIAIIDKVYQSALGITATFLSKKFDEKGWRLDE